MSSSYEWQNGASNENKGIFLFLAAAEKGGGKERTDVPPFIDDQSLYLFQKIPPFQLSTQPHIYTYDPPVYLPQELKHHEKRVQF